MKTEYCHWATQRKM